MLEKGPAHVKKTPRSEDVPCDDTWSCPDDNTCCRTVSGKWGCCPILKAVCCSDHTHCCPSGYTCNVEQGTCSKGDNDITMFEKGPAHLKETPRSEDVPCDDTWSCPDGNTCCRTASGEWGCCPILKAVCCSDHIHCCPNGYTCNVEQGTCQKGDNVATMLKKAPAHLKEMPHIEDVPCDKTESCPDGNTCCRTASGDWGCCPMLKAVCCSDHIHCCPNGYTCNVKQGTCSKEDNIVAMFEKGPAHVKETPRIGDVPCDETESCPDGNTCCRTASGEWGCCPILKAVCCSDHIHCCPNGYTCNVEQGTCLKGDNVVIMLKKGPTLVKEMPRLKDVSCDDTESCPDGNTCCRTAFGEWGCCPVVDAVCCSDHIHCCPSGYTCDVEQRSCLRKETMVRIFTKSVADKRELRRSAEVPCDDIVSCPDSSTCCRTISGDWGCCPSSDAVCCSDHIHCCPNGYTCDTEQGTCLQGDEVVTMFTKIPVHMKLVPDSEDVRCDDTASCPDGSTCCKTASGVWGCCPLVKAVCCSDHIHCCPSGYTCNVQQGTCLRENNVLAMFKKGPADMKEVRRNEGVPCDDRSSCPDGSTCCRTVSGNWGCCPMVNAVCCSDHVHCCPYGYICDLVKQSCIGSNVSVSWQVKNAAHVKEEKEAQGNTPCDESTSCPSSATCCKLASGKWACCPLLRAVCCTDGLHCCPSGYRCAGDSCIQEKGLRWDGGFFGRNKMKRL